MVDPPIPPEDVPDAPSDARPDDVRRWHTDELPPTPLRTHAIAATQWVEAPEELLALGTELSLPVAGYRRRIGRYLLFRAGPPSRGDAWYMALAADRPAERHTFRLFPDGSGRGEGPDGVTHTRLRTWKEALRDASLGSLAPMEAARWRDHIERERRRIAALAEDLAAGGIRSESEGEQLSELASHDQHQADLGSETFEREKDLSILEALESELAELQAASERLEAGEYGRCEVCGEAIPDERLEALPAARYCVRHQGR